jgi:hypothetical protein
MHKRGAFVAIDNVHIGFKLHSIFFGNIQQHSNTATQHTAHSTQQHSSTATQQHSKHRKAAGGLEFDKN